MNIINNLFGSSEEKKSTDESNKSTNDSNINQETTSHKHFDINESYPSSQSPLGPKTHGEKLREEAANRPFVQLKSEPAPHLTRPLEYEEGKSGELGQTTRKLFE
ncbi:hypothetical protein ABK040_011153 [Willaertia magna]